MLHPSSLSLSSSPPLPFPVVSRFALPQKNRKGLARRALSYQALQAAGVIESEIARETAVSPEYRYRVRLSPPSWSRVLSLSLCLSISLLSLRSASSFALIAACPVFFLGKMRAIAETVVGERESWRVGQAEIFSPEESETFLAGRSRSPPLSPPLSRPVGDFPLSLRFFLVNPVDQDESSCSVTGLYRALSVFFIYVSLYAAERRVRFPFLMIVGARRRNLSSNCSYARHS